MTPETGRLVFESSKPPSRSFRSTGGLAIGLLAAVGVLALAADTRGQTTSAWPGHTEVHFPEPGLTPPPAAPLSKEPGQSRAVWRVPRLAQPMHLLQPAEIPPPADLFSAPPLPFPQPAQPAELAVAPADYPFVGPVPVEQLVQYALATNPEIQAARYRARALAARVPQLSALPDPQLITTAFLEEIQTAAGPQEVILSLSQHFPLFGKRPLRAEVAWYDAMAAFARVLTTELGVIERVERAYFDLYFLQSAMRESRRLEAPLEDLIEVARSRYETNVPGAGLESVLQLQIELAKLKTRLAELEQARLRARARLARELSLPPSLPVDAVEPLEQTPIEQTADMLVALAETYQPELEAWRREAARDQTAVVLARRNYLPDATVSFNWIDIGQAGLAPMANGRDAFSLGVGVNLPIYHQRLEAAVREAQCKAAATARHYVATRDELRAEVQSLYAELMEHNQVLTILDQQIVPRAEQTFELTAESYRAGRGEFQQLIDAFRVLLEYRIERHRRAALREQAIASLKRAVGETVSGPAGP